MRKGMANKKGIMHESKGQHIGKATSLNLFTLHTTSSQSLLAVHGCSLVLRPLPPPTWPGNEASMILDYSVKDVGIGLCQYVDLCFHAISLPCLHAFGMPSLHF